MDLFWILIATHVFLCVFLVLLVLVQNDKGGGLAGALTGGASNAAFSGTGAASAISKLTQWVAIMFMVVILGINYVVSQGTTQKVDSKLGDARKELSSVLAPASVPALNPPSDPVVPAMQVAPAVANPAVPKGVVPVGLGGSI